MPICRRPAQTPYHASLTTKMTTAKAAETAAASLKFWPLVMLRAVLILQCLIGRLFPFLNRVVAAAWNRRRRKKAGVKSCLTKSNLNAGSYSFSDFGLGLWFFKSRHRLRRAASNADADARL